MLRALAALAFPAACPGCGCPAEPVCTSCARTLRAPAPAPPPLGVDAWVAAFTYEGIARELVARVKYRNTHAAIGWLADAVASACDRLPNPAPQAITWVPTTAAHRRARGFDHAELLARAVGRRLDLQARGLLRRLPGPHQTGRPVADRRQGPLLACAAAARQSRVLVVDDVATTGASLRASAETLRDIGVDCVYAATAARTPAPVAPNHHGE